jgi:hypothetical protein
MAGEFDPLNAGAGDLYSIAGGIPGGGPVGAGMAGQMFQQQLQEKAAQAELLRQQAFAAQQQGQRTQALTQPEVQQTLGLAGLYGGQTQHLGAETQGLQQSNLARLANLPGEIGATGAKFGAETAQSQRSAFEAKASMALPFAPDFRSYPTDTMRETAIDAWGAQKQLSKDSNWSVIKDALMKGQTGPQALGSYYALSPKISEEQTKGLFELEKAKIMGSSEVQSAQVRGGALRDIQTSRERIARTVVKGSTGDQLATLQNMQREMMTNPNANQSDLIALDQQIQMTSMRYKLEQSIANNRTLDDAAKAEMQRAITQMIAPGEQTAPPLDTKIPPNVGALPNQSLAPQPNAQPNQAPGQAPPRATNQATGQIIELRDGKWVPVQ